MEVLWRLKDFNHFTLYQALLSILYIYLQGVCFYGPRLLVNKRELGTEMWAHTVSGKARLKTLRFPRHHTEVAAAYRDQCSREVCPSSSTLHSSLDESPSGWDKERGDELTVTEGDSSTERDKMKRMRWDSSSGVQGVIFLMQSNVFREKIPVLGLNSCHANKWAMETAGCTHITAVGVIYSNPSL